MRTLKVKRLTNKDVGDGQLLKTLLQTLQNLSSLDGLGTKEAREILKKVLSNPVYHIFVAVEEDAMKIKAAATLLVEQKLIHGGGKVGHIEDVVTQKGFEGRGIGSSVLEAAIQMAKEQGCYKVILNCSDKNVPFYEKFGFYRHETGMRLDLR